MFSSANIHAAVKCKSYSPYTDNYALPGLESMSTSRKHRGLYLIVILQPVKNKINK